MTQKKNYLLTIALALCLSLIMTILLVIPMKGYSATTVQDEEPYRVERFSQPDGGMLDVRTSGGHVTVSVPGGVGYDLELRGSRVRSDLANFSGQLERDEVEGTVNGGGARLFARTSGGTVRLNFH